MLYRAISRLAIVVGALAGLATTLVFFIRWQNRNYSQQAGEEFYLRQFQRDFERASWLVEMLHEWKAEYPETEIPDGLVDTLGRGLFIGGYEPPPEVEHPSSELIAKFLGTSSSVKVNLPGGSAEFDRKSIKKAQKDAT